MEQHRLSLKNDKGIKETLDITLAISKDIQWQLQQGLARRPHHFNTASFGNIPDLSAASQDETAKSASMCLESALSVQLRE